MFSHKVAVLFAMWPLVLSAQSKWVVFSKAGSHPYVAVDTASFSRVAPEHVGAWLKMESGSRETVPGTTTPFAYVVSFHIVDCTTKQVAIVQGAWYTSEGTVIHSYTMPSGEEPTYSRPVPDSYEDGTVWLLCRMGTRMGWLQSQ